jgi:glucose-1-phosphate adenylyltransferase
MRPLDVRDRDGSGGLPALRETVSMVMAGGEGERLYPLTRDRAKPAVPFAGSYRLIDFTLSNCLNSGLRRVHVLTQYKSDSLNRHIRLGWNVYDPELGEYVEVNPPQMRLTSHWYLGTADAIHQNIYTLERERPEFVLVLSGDHVYRMDYSQLVRQHVETGADLTIVCQTVPRREASRLGVVDVDKDLRVHEIAEKPDNPAPAPGYVADEEPSKSLCSMGVYLFDTETLVRRVVEDSKRNTTHDFGRDVIPAMIDGGDEVYGYRFHGVKEGNNIPYWRDVGTLDAYWGSHMELLSATPSIDLHDSTWPIRSYVEPSPPVKTVCGSRDSNSHNTGQVCDSLLCNGAIVQNARVSRSVLGSGVRIHSGTVVEDSIILSNCEVGPDAVVKKAIVDKNNRIPSEFELGVNHDNDDRYFTVSDGGVVVVPKEMPLFRET